VHPPSQVDVQYLDQFISALRVRVPSDTVQQGGDIDICPNNGVKHPLYAEVRDASEVTAEGVNTVDGDCVAWSEALSREEAEKSGFAGAVCADEERAAAGWEVQGDVGQAGLRSVWEAVGQVADVDGGVGCIGVAIGKRHREQL